MMNKGYCILLVRVSTLRQDFDEQEKQLYDLAINDGYKDSEIIPICEKESGIKLKEDERRGLNRMKEIIEEGNVTCVYAWEVSRIGRKKKVIFSITEYLAERHIQLIVKEPYLKLLNADGTVNDAAETVLTLYAQIAESEMRNKQSRWARTRKHNAEIGKWNGGKSVKFGYKLDADNYYIIDEEQAKVIRTLYDLYVSSRMGQRQIKKEMAARGYILTEDRIRKVLSDVGYTGEPYVTKMWSTEKKCYVSGQTVRYPAIIDAETFQKAAQKREGANKSVYRGEKYYFGANLMKCVECGHSYVGYGMDNLYMCVAHRHANHDIEVCHNNVTVNLTALDSLLWHVAYVKHFKWLYEHSSQQREQLTKELEILDEKIAREQGIIEGVEERLSDIAEMVIDRMLTKEKGKVKAARVREEAEKSEALIAQYRQRQATINEMLTNDETQQNAALVDALNGILSVETLKQMSDIVHKYVVEVQAESYEHGETKRIYGLGPYRVITISFIDGDVQKYLIYARGNKYQFMSYDLDTPEPGEVKIIDRGLKRNDNRLSRQQRERRKMRLQAEAESNIK